MKAKRTVSKRRLQQYLNELVALAKTVTPDVEPITHIPGDEEQHAWLKLYVPDEFVDQVDDLISERVYEIFIKEGYDIAAIAYDKSLLHHTPVEAIA
jgi:hypothetical protein